MPKGEHSIGRPRDFKPQIVHIGENCSAVLNRNYFQIYVDNCRCDLDMLEAITLRNKITEWANNKKTRDRRKEMPSG